MPNVQTKRKKKKNRKRKIRRTVTVLLLLIIAAVCLCLFTPFFNISSISVAGNEQVASEDILARCGILENTNIFRINKKASRTSLESLAYLDTIKIKRKLPNKVVIEVTETTASLLFPFMTGYIVTDSTGKVLEQTTDAETWDLPQILGAGVENAEISKKITVQDTVKFGIIVDSIRYLQEKELLPQIRECNFEDISNFRMKMRDGIEIIFGKIEDMDYKLKKLETVLPQVDKSEGSYLDLSTPAKAFYGRNEPAVPATSGEPGTTAELQPDTNQPEGENESD